MTKTTKTTAKFMDRGLQAIKSLRRRKSGYTGQEIRVTLEEQGIKPKHYNAWGALINKASMDGILKLTDEVRSAILPQSKGRQLSVYTR